jgi:serine phosphatase RsbU (regulator of sigma subunit)
MKIAGFVFLFLIGYSLQAFSQADSVSYFENKLEQTHSEKDQLDISLRLCQLYFQTGNDNTAKLYGAKSLEIATKRGDSLALGDANSLLSLIYSKGLQNEKALAYLIQAEKYFKDHEERLPMLYLQKGELLYYNHDFKHAIDLFRKVNKLALKVKQNMSRLLANDDIGNVYFERKMLDSSLFFYKKCLEIPFERKDSMIYEGLYNNIGNVYITMGENEVGKDYLLKALRLAEKYNLKGAIPVIYYNLAGVETDLKQFKNAKEHLVQSMKMGNVVNDKRNLTYCYNLLGRVDSALGLKKEALISLNNLAVLIDSLHGADMYVRMANMQGKFEAETKDNQIQLLHKDQDLDAEKIKRQQQITLLIAVGLIVCCFLSVLLYRFYRAKIKANHLLEIQKKEIEIRRQLLADKNRQIEDSINYARRIQEAVLPSVLFTKEEVQDQFVYFNPRDIVSGDFYWKYRWGNYLFFAVVDCTGHGVPGAMMSMLGYDLLEHALVDRKLMEPAEILNELNVRVIEKLSNNALEGVRDGMDMTLCRYNLNTGELTFSGSRNDLFVMTGANLQVMPVDKVSIGDHPDSRFHQNSIFITEKDTVYLFTDGFYDQKGGPEGKKYLISRFRQLLTDLASLSGKEQMNKLNEAHLSWKGINQQRDDILVVGMKFRLNKLQ